MKPKTKISEAQKEIIYWKEKASEKISNFTLNDTINYLTNYQVAFIDFVEKTKTKNDIKSKGL